MKESVTVINKTERSLDGLYVKVCFTDDVLNRVLIDMDKSDKGGGMSFSSSLYITDAEVLRTLHNEIGEALTEIDKLEEAS